MKNALLLLSLVLAAAPLHAQVRQVAFRTLCLEFAGDLQSLTLPGKDGAAGPEVKLFTDISPVTEAGFATSEAVFYTGKPGPDGKPAEVAARAPLGKSARQLFLFVPTGAGAGKPKYSLHCFDDDLQAFPMGNVRAINLAPVAVRFILSGQTTPEIPPGRNVRFPHSKKVNDYDMYPVVVEFQKADKQWARAQSVSWKATDRRREIVVTLIDPRFKQPTVRMYSDFPPWLDRPAAP